MATSRASNGSTSSGDTFWLMPAMRRKERSGPGMEVVAVDVEGVEPESPRADNHGKAQSNTAGIKTRRQEDFIAHILRPSRKAV